MNMQGGVFRAGRYEIRYASMLDLIDTAYGVDADTVVGGPAWLETDRFDVIAKAPPGTSPETVKLMLQSLLADRFKLEVRKETRPMAGFVLSVGKGKPKLKQADASGESGCERQPPPPPNGDFPTIPPQAVSCRNMTMTDFAASLRGLDRGYLTSPVVDSTGLKGAWDFDFKWTGKLLLPLAGADGVALFDAIDKQLGLKLEEQKVPMPVIVVVRVNQKPSANSPDASTALPPRPPAEFEVASIRANPPGASLGPPGGLQPGGRYEQHGFPMFIMIRQAWDITTPANEEIPGAPKWLTLNYPLFDIIAKVPESAIASGTQIYTDDLHSMMRALLEDRFKMRAHYEDRPMDAYTLVAEKPKLKKADPANRAGCKLAPPQLPRDGDITPPPFVATCQNITMAQFAEQVQTLAPVYLRYPVVDGTGIEGAWDFTLTFTPVPPGQLGGGGRNGGGKGGPAPAGGGAAGVASDPIGGTSLFDAVEKQLGLKLEVHKRPEPVFVIDHLEEKPTDN
jgi:uncharacterized protein (TIGR03435 family)